MRYLLNFKFFFILFFSLFSFQVKADDTSIVLTLTLEDMIHEGTVQTIEELYDEAKDIEADLILITLDTPGGLLDSTENIVKLFLNSEIPFIVQVGPRGARAGSAGTFITMAAHVASMAPGTYIGAAHPVSAFGGGGEENADSEVMNKKIESAVSSFITAIAKQRQRNEEWARKAVLESDSITEDQAVEMNVVDFIAKDQIDLLNKIHGKKIKVLDEEMVLNTKNAEIIEFEVGWKLALLNSIASPNFMYILFLLMIAGIYLEVSNPGLIIPGSVAGICMILLLIASRTMPIDYIGIFLIILALVLLVTEIFVTSFGLLTVGGLVSFVAGSLFLFDPSEVGVRVSFSYIVSATLSLIIISVFVGYTIIKGMNKKQLLGNEAIIGEIGRAVKDFPTKGKGKVFFQGEYWGAISDDKIVQEDEIVVEGISHLTLKVSKKV